MSGNLVSEISEKINSNEELSEKNIRIKKFQFLKKSNILKVILRANEILTIEEEEELKKLLKNTLPINTKLQFTCYKDIRNISLEEVVKEHWVEVIDEVLKQTPIAKDCLLKGKKEIRNSEIYIYYGNDLIINHMKINGVERQVKKAFEDLFGVNVQLNLIYDASDYKEMVKQVEKEQKEIVNKVIGERKNKVLTTKKEVPVVTMREVKRDVNDKVKNQNIIIGKYIKEEIVLIKGVSEESGIVVITGEIFKVETREIKSGKIILTFFITDLTSSITVKKFLEPKECERVLEEVKKGVCCKVRGDARYDVFSKETVIMARDIVKMQKIEKMDISQEKRVELHCHTTMSAMDAVSSASKIIERAAKWGHPAVAITDHGVVQAFPEAMDAGKKTNTKIIYGVEGYLVDNGVPIVLSDNGESIKSMYVVFDLETTGFSSRNDKIIEIGAVKVFEEKIIDRFSCFVNPKIDIPYKITELTGITDEMVEHAEEIKTVLPKFLEFIGESVVVAHNAGFDTAFIKNNCKEFNCVFKAPIMDTVPLIRYLYPELKKVKLNIVAKHLGISLESNHRAIDDAEATALILLKCFEELRQRGILDLKRLNEEFLGNIDIKKQPMYHIIILARTQQGLKNLYKLISESHLNNFFRKPRIPKTLLQEYREGLIIGSACEAGQLYKSILDGKSDAELEEIVDFYDYLEIQPIDNNNFLIEKGNVKDEIELQEINRRIYNLGNKYNKLTVATGDVHFLDSEDEVFRRIILAGQGYSDADKQPPLYFRTTGEMLKEFRYLGEDIAKEVVITNTNKIAGLIEDIKPIPDETFPPKIEGAEEEIKNMTLNKVHSIYGDNLPDIVQKRLDKELNSIINNGYAVLYLIANKLVAKSLQDGYLVGSRGSVGSSFVATMSDITEVNGLPPHYVCPNCKKSEFFLDGSVASGADLPIKNCPNCRREYIRDGHDIPFETFLGFEGDKEPDIDLNFSGEYQAVVHKYTEVLFGEGYTFKAGTIGTVAEKTAYGYVRKYLDEKGIICPMAEIERLTAGCTGIKRTSGQHPGGIMVVPRDNEIYNFSPIQHPADDNDTDIITTHFDYHSISGRLLKLDILGHDDPTVLRMLQDLTGLDPKTIPLNDKNVISLFTSTEALGVTAEELGCEVGTYGLPEFGTKFVRQMLLDTQPKSFADLVRISGLSHGTDVWLNNAQYYIKEGYTTLSECIATRDDIMVYLMYKDLPPKMAFTIMEKVRKGKGLSEADEFIMREKKVPEWYIESCKKIKYMFPKGHAVAYVMMAIRIAYYKVYYPEAYYATYFTVRADEFDADLICKGEKAVKNRLDELYKLGNNVTVKDKGAITTLEICYEMYKRGFKLLKVDLYESEAIKFKIEEGGIRPPLSALVGVADNAAKNIVDVRGYGEFISKEDLRIRAKVSKTVIESLESHGCLKGMQNTNQVSLFG